MGSENYILTEFRKAIRVYNAADILDLDRKIDFKFNFLLARLEEVFRDGPRQVPPNKWSYYRIALFVNGSAEFKTGIHHFKATPNSLVVVRSRMITTSKDWSEDLKGYILLFNEEFFLHKKFSSTVIDNRKMFKYSMRPYVQLNEEETRELAVTFEELLKINNEPESIADELINAKTIEVMVRSDRLFQEKQKLESNASAIEVIKKFTDLVETNFITERTVQFYARQMNLHPNYLNAQVKKLTGLTAKESIQNRVLLEIKFLLHTTSFSIKEIASKLSFSDSNYFTSFFKNAEKVSPVQYRASFS